MPLNNLFNIAGVKLREAIHPTEEKAASRKNILFSYYTGGMAQSLAGGNFFTGLLLLLQADDAFIGFISMTALLGNLIQVFSPFLLERFPSRKKLLIFVRMGFYLLYIVFIGLIPYLDFTNKIKLSLILVIVLLYSLLNGITAPGYSIWHIKSIPDEVRAKFFSFYQITNNVIVYTLILGSSWIIDKFKASGMELTGMEIFRLVAIIFCAVEIFFLSKIKEYPYEKSLTPVNLVNIFLNPFRQRKYLMSVVIACLWSFFANMIGPYMSVYMLKDLKSSYSFLNLVAVINVPILALSTPIWSKIIQKTSWFRGLYFSMMLYGLSYVGFMFVTKDTMFLFVVFSIFSAIMAPGINLSFMNLHYINLPEKDQSNYLGFYMTMYYLMAFMGVSLGNAFISLTENLSFNIFGMEARNKQVLMLITAVGIIFGASVIRMFTRRTEKKIG